MKNHFVYIYTDEPDLSFIEISKGDWVVIKPNLVKESKETDNDEWESVITSPDLIKKVCKYVSSILKNTGRVSICDAPQTDSSFRAIAKRLGLNEIVKYCSEKYGTQIEIIDLRDEEWKSEDGVIVKRESLSGDPNGKIKFNLGKNSLFYGYPGEGRYYGADYESSVVNNHHKEEKQEYLVCATPIIADVFINMPKMKTHKKTGVTLSLKNLVGINADKNWLPHHTESSPGFFGDEYPELTLLRKIEQKSVKIARRIAIDMPIIGPMLTKKLRKAGTKVFGDGSNVIRSGNWHGNDTAWRMVLDLNRCLLYGKPDGTLRRNRRKKYFTLIDGRVGMEGNGPMQGDPFHAGVLVGGKDPVAVDCVAARLMGFDWEKIPLLREGWKISKFSISDISPNDIEIVSNHDDWCCNFKVFEKKRFFRFRPHFGWLGKVEFDER